MPTTVQSEPSEATVAPTTPSSDLSWNVETIVDCPGQPGAVSQFYGSEAQADSIYNTWNADVGQPYPGMTGCTFGSVTVPEQVGPNGALQP